MSKRKKISIKDIIFMAIIILLSILFLFPFYWILTGAFKNQSATIQIPPQWFPKPATFQNFIDLAKSPLLKWTFNSFFISFCTMLLVCITSTMGGYVLAKKKDFQDVELYFGYL